MHAIAREIAAEAPRLRRYARRLTRNADRAEDLVQDCMERALQRQDQFRPGTCLSAWLMAIMRSIFFNQCRRALLEREYLQEISLQPPATLPPAQPAHLELSETLAAMDRLADEHRDILNIVAIGQKSHAEAAAAMGVAVGTAKTRLHRAREQLRLALGA